MVADINSQDYILVEPDASYRDAFLDMIDDYAAHGDERYQDIRYLVTHNFEAYVQGLIKYSQGVNLIPGHVPQTSYWMIDKNRTIVGTIRVRHRLTRNLGREGGHIGYDIRPSCRGRGLGTLQLSLALEKAHQLGIHQVLITCDTDNLASARVIEKNGGRLENRVSSPYSGKSVSRYWVELN